MAPTSPFLLLPNIKCIRTKYNCVLNLYVASIVTYHSSFQKIIVTIGNITVAHLESKKLCTPRKVLIGLRVTKQQLELSVDSHTDRSSPEQLSFLHQAVMANVVTYLGGLPGELYFFSLMRFVCENLIIFSFTQERKTMQVLSQELLVFFIQWIRL